MKEKILKYSIFITGFACLYVFIAVRFLPMYNTLLTEKLVPNYWDKTRYGELYYFSHIKYFREPNLPEATVKHQFSKKQPSINETEIFTFGDSFFDIVRPVQFPTLLSEALNKKVFFGYNDYPLQYLNKNNYHDTVPKIMVMGIVERFIPLKFTYRHDTGYLREEEKSGAFVMGKTVKDLIFYKKGEELYDAALKRSYLTTGIYSTISTIKFDLFGYISRFTPFYSLDDTIPWLFHHNAVNQDSTSFYYHHSEEQVTNMATTLQELSVKLKEIYNITFVFMPIPSKYTIYHTKFNNDPYNNFIPRLQQKLAERDVLYIDLYSHFLKADKLIYFGTDGHWNENGTRLAVALTKQYLIDKKLIHSHI